jgi:hypothetical protein
VPSRRFSVLDLASDTDADDVAIGIGMGGKSRELSWCLFREKLGNGGFFSGAQPVGDGVGTQGFHGHGFSPSARRGAMNCTPLREGDGITARASVTGVTACRFGADRAS